MGGSGTFGNLGSKTGGQQVRKGGDLGPVALGVIGQGERKRKVLFRQLVSFTTPFFFTHFLENLSNSDLRKLFARYGNVEEVFVPRKRDKWGRRFGFVKYKEVTNEEVLWYKLEEVWWGDMKLKVNRARFGREAKWEREEVVGGNMGGQGAHEVSRKIGDNGKAALRQGTTFANVV